MKFLYILIFSSALTSCNICQKCTKESVYNYAKTTFVGEQDTTFAVFPTFEETNITQHGKIYTITATAQYMNHGANITYYKFLYEFKCNCLNFELIRMEGELY